METMIIKVEGKEHLLFLEELLAKFQFVKEIETKQVHETILKKRYKNLPIKWAKHKPDPVFASNLLKNRTLMLGDIRQMAWKRNL